MNGTQLDREFDLLEEVEYQQYMVVPKVKTVFG
jgi:hypothetical protein